MTGSSLVAADPPSAGPTLVADEAGYRDVVAPFLKAHCQRCHGPAKQEGEFRVDTQLKNAFLDPTAKEKWGEVVNVLNSHEMPPEKEPQPKPDDVAAVVDWITRQFSRAELARRDSAIIMRRMNRDEYRNTIRDLVGIDFDVSGFPQDPAAGGFDNNGGALTFSPMHLELYLDAARKIVDRAMIEPGTAQPESNRWRFEPDVGDGDHSRVRFGKQNPIVHGGKNPVVDGFKVMHHDSWDRHLNARDFKMPLEGDYIIRVRAGGKIPGRQDVVESARKALADRRDKQLKENPKGERWHKEAFERDLAHFEKDRIYDYGSPRLKLIQTLGGQPRTLAEFDVTGSVEKPGIHEFRARFTTESAGLTIEYCYPIPKVLENFWMQNHDSFARPEAWVDWFEIEGPVYDNWPPSSHARLMGKAPASAAPDKASPKNGESQVARTILSRFMRRAYRRPVTDAELTEKLALYERARKESSSMESALKTPFVAVLCSPHFLYLTEPSSGPARPLDNHELASRLSYFLWSSMPDDELFQLAESGKLRDPKVLAAQVDRLLKDSRSEAFVRNFAGQWLGLREVGANPPAMDLYPQYDRHLETSIVEESRSFFAEILKQDLSVMNFVHSDFVVINERLARFYGIPDVKGDEFRRVSVPKDVHRGGIVTQASVLTITSNGTRTSPVKRGTWVMKNLLGTDPGLPVANAGDIAPKVPGIDKATVRKRLEIHRTLAQCARCHNKIDPLGFALENYNAAGEWREQEGFGYKGRIERNDPKIDASSKLPDGTEITGVEGLQTALLKQEDLFLKCLSNKLMTYALGRELGVADQPTVKASVDHLKQNQYTLRSLIQFIVQSKPFGSK